MITLLEVTEGQIREAEWINAVDPRTGHCEMVWGLEDQHTPPQSGIDILDVEVPEFDRTGLLRLIERVEQVKGRLSPRVQSLRGTLQQATAQPPQTFSDGDLIANR